MIIEQVIKKLHVFSMVLLLLPVLMMGCVVDSLTDPSTLEDSINNVKSENEVSNKGLVNTTLIKGILQDQKVV